MKMSMSKLFEDSQRKLVLGKDCFDYLGLLYLSPNKILSFDKKIDRLNRILTIGEERVLSRNREFYTNMSLSDIFSLDEFIYDLYHELVVEKGKHEETTFLKTIFSVLEQRINIGLKLYYSHFESGIKNNGIDIEEHDIIKRRLENDYASLISIMHGQIPEELDKTLFRNKINNGFSIEGRLIEMDNKYLLFSRMRDLWLQEDELNKVCSPMLGGIQIPFMLEATYNFLNNLFDKEVAIPECFHIIYGEHDNIEYGKIVRDKNLTLEQKLKSIRPKNLGSVFEGDRIVILDDNTGTGETLRNLRKLFKEVYGQVDFGFIELSWKYLDDINSGKRAGKCFSVDEVKYPTFRNYRHHTILDSLVSAINKSDPEEYYRKLKGLGFQNGYVSDTECLFNQGHNYARKNNITFAEPSIQILTELSYELETSYTNFILSLDIMNSRIRYLEQHNPFEIADLVMNFKKVNIIDLDRHYGKVYNEELIKILCSMKDCRVGGGVRTPEDIEKLLSLGAYKVIITTCATPKLLENFPQEKIVVGVDSIDRRTNLPNDVPKRMRILDPYASDFQYICVETDGKMKGGDLERGIEYAKLTNKPYAIVGGITFPHEIVSLREKGIYAVVGRAIFENLFGDKL